MEKIKNKTEEDYWNCEFVLTPEKVDLIFQKKLARIEQYNNLNQQRERIIENMH